MAGATGTHLRHRRALIVWDGERGLAVLVSVPIDDAVGDAEQEPDDQESEDVC